jgi:hypothetical protein
MNISIEPMELIFHKTGGKMITYEYYINGPLERPVIVIHDTEKGTRTLAYEWETGEFQENQLIHSSILNPLGDAEELTEQEFKDYVRELNARLTMDTPAYYVWAGTPFIAERDAEGRLRVWGFNHMTGEMDNVCTAYDIVSRKVSQTTIRATKEAYDRCVAALKEKWREKQAKP